MIFNLPVSLLLANLASTFTLHQRAESKVDLDQLKQLNLLPPNGEIVYLELEAAGVQIYNCNLTNGGNFTLTKPEADLFLDGQRWGFHTFNPDANGGKAAWIKDDKTFITVKKNGEAVSPSGADKAIAWLLTEKTSGDLEDFTHVGRINTEGGVSPVPSQCTTDNKEIKVSYTTLYIFFAPPRADTPLTAEEPTEEPAEKPTEEPAEEPTEEPAEKPSEDPYAPYGYEPSKESTTPEKYGEIPIGVTAESNGAEQNSGKEAVNEENSGSVAVKTDKTAVFSVTSSALTGYRFEITMFLGILVILL